MANLDPVTMIAGVACSLAALVLAWRAYRSAAAEHEERKREKERDEARQSASESTFQVREFEKKLTEASSLLTGWKSGNGKHLVGAQNGRNDF